MRIKYNIRPCGMVQHRCSAIYIARCTIAPIGRSWCNCTYFAPILHLCTYLTNSLRLNNLRFINYLNATIALIIKNLCSLLARFRNRCNCTYYTRLTNLAKTL